jgi:microcystin-dependent protein
MSEPFIAEVRIFAGNFAPRGWAFCDGQLLPISQNTALFALVGTTYGGDGRTTLALPDLKDRAPMHPGRGPGLTQRRLGQRGGEKSVTLTEAQMSSHNHTLGVTRKTAGSGDPTAGKLADSPLGDKQFHSVESNLAGMKSETLKHNGGGQSHNNLPPYLAMNFIIALTGLFPSRS